MSNNKQRKSFKSYFDTPTKALIMSSCLLVAFLILLTPIILYACVIMGVL